MRSLSKDKSKNFFSEEEQKMLLLYLEEFNDLFPDILQYPSGKFLSNLFKRSKISLSQKFNVFSSSSVAKIEKYFIEKYYPTQYNLAYNSMKQIKFKQETLSPLMKVSLVYNGNNYIKHCRETKEPLHTCGNKLLSNKSYINEKESLMLFCVNCNQIYKDSFIKMSCSTCNNSEYYTKILSKDELNPNSLLPATWAKYHCNAIINDLMKCLQCKEVLFWNQKDNLLVCLKCSFSIQPNLLKWICVFCKNEFNSDVKVYNPLEFKLMKISVKDTLIARVRAVPPENEFICGCNIDYATIKFIHKKTCKGQMYLGVMNKKKILVCSLCRSLNYYDNFTWICPVCEQVGKRGKMISDKRISRHNKLNSDDFNEKKGIIRYNSSKKNNNNNNEKIRKISIEHNLHTSSNIPPSPGKNMIPLPLSSSKKDNGDNKENFNGLNRMNSLKNIKKQPNQIYMIKKKLIEKFNEDETAEKAKEKDKSSLLYSPPKIIRLNSSFSAQDAQENQQKENNSPKSNNFNSDEYDIKAKIGEGSFGKIYLVQKNGIKYAMKKIVGTTVNELRSLQHEYEILSSISTNKNLSIINIYGFQTKCLDRTTFVMYILMELAVTDWEKEIIQRSKLQKYYSEPELVERLKILLKTFSELQVENVSHRDIKPQNILICPGGVVKVADFGEAKELMKNTPNTGNQTLRGTELFMSPILFKALRNRRCAIIKHNSFKSDVFSLGLCFLLSATLTFNSIYDIRELETDEAIEKTIKKYIQTRYSEKFIKILQKMLEYNEKERFDFIEMERAVNIEFL